MTDAPAELIKEYADLHAEAVAAAEAVMATEGEVAATQTFLRTLARAGLSTPAWPERCGGRGLPADVAAELEQFVAERQVRGPSLYPTATGTHLVGPVLIKHGTVEQQERWCPSIADGSDIWCQMFSEPNAGSDLANVHMSAVRDGAVWRLNGQKVWTSKAHYARWAICLARTDPNTTKHKGLTMFVVDMTDPAVVVRPLVQMNGDHHFSEVFVDDCRVPDDARIGDVGEGWTVALSTLGFERAAAGLLQEDSGDLGLPSWLVELKESGRIRTRDQRLLVVDAYILVMLGELTARRAAAGGGSGPEGSGSKLRTVRAFRAMTRALSAVDGADGLLTDAPSTQAVLTMPSMSIRGGTDEIQKNILGERVLGLPAEARADKDIAWSQGLR